MNIVVVPRIVVPGVIVPNIVVAIVIPGNGFANIIAPILIIATCIT